MASPTIGGSNSSPLDIYTKGTQAWFPDQKEGWILGSLTNKSVANDKVAMTFYITSQNKVWLFGI